MAKITKTASFHVSDLEGKQRLDLYLASQNEELTRTIVANAALWLNGKPAKKGNPVQTGDERRKGIPFRPGMKSASNTP